ncbi:LysR family transcriptional regulator [Sterolibacterium denitrificans]|nr:LysR family transcriptional regulator [Sterolibacterium denitrificans]
MLHTSMREINLRKLDLNLLVALDVLLTMEEVSAAAAKMCLTQSAMSHTLQRLREHFDDPLLVKGKGRMVKTPRAEALAAPLRRALLELQHAIQCDVEFVPATSRHCFHIATNDYGDWTLMPQLMARLAEQAPHVDVKISHFDPENSIVPLESGSIELVFCHPVKHAVGIQQETLFEEDFCCATRAQHPRIGRHLDLDTYLAQSHLRIAPRGGQRDLIDKTLARLGKQRRIALSTPNLSSAPVLLTNSDLVLTAPRRCVQAWQKLLPISLHEPPVALPGFTIAMIWHERFEHDPANLWLRAQMREICHLASNPAAPVLPTRAKADAPRPARLAK